MSHEERKFFVLYPPSEPRAEYDLEKRTVREIDSAPQGLVPELTFDIDEATQQAEQDALLAMRNGRVNPAVYDQIYAQAEYRGGPRTIREAMVEVWIGAGSAISLTPDESGVFILKEQVDQLCAPPSSDDPDRVKRLMHELIDRAFTNGSDRKSTNERFRAAAEVVSRAAKIKMTADEMIETLARDLQNIYHTRGVDQLPCVVLVADLALQGELWSRFKRGGPINPYQLGFLLGKQGVDQSRVFRVGKKQDAWGLPIGKLYRGYHRSQLEELFKAYEAEPRKVAVQHYTEF
jgi:hypothetical protein